MCYFARSMCDVKISEYDLLLSTITSVHVNNHITFMKLLQKLKKKKISCDRDTGRTTAKRHAIHQRISGQQGHAEQ
jgi:hypothetical protein